MFKKQRVVEEVQKEFKKKVEIDSADKLWMDAGNVDMKSAFVGAPEKRLIKRIEDVVEASKNVLVLTTDIERVRLLQGQINAMQSILGTIKQWQDYAKSKEK